MTEFKLYVNGAGLNGFAGNIEWSSNKDTLGCSLSFEVPFGEEGTSFPERFIKPGDKVTLRHGANLEFFGIIVDEAINGRNPVKYTAFDLAFYLNKSEMTIQFNKKPISQCIEQICKKYNIRCEVIPISTPITKIYKGEVASEIIKDLLDTARLKTGTRYRFEMKGDRFNVFKWVEMKNEVYTHWIDSPTRNLSIQEMKNSILVVADGEKISKPSAIASDESNIAKYGLLTKVETISDKEKRSAQTVANNLLKQLNKVQETGGGTFVGDRNVRAGRLFKLNERVTGWSGDVVITDAKHSISNGIHLMQLSWEVWDE
ncbi:MAG: hypothetical protein ABS944_16360 [Solibacillus sp.]|uniref:XkdQ/YqbQ family protein n=1 Tax=Solibacillus sp. TaxID=1909654 RepID=UPI003315ED13